VRAVLAFLLVASTGAPARAQDAPAAPTVAPHDRAERDRWLAARLDAALAARPELGPARVGIAVDDAAGRPLYRHAGADAFNIASNVKVVTTAAALALLGPAYRYKTQVLVDGLDATGTVTGNLYLRASGDPSLDEAALWSLANEVAVLGVRRVTGSLVVDDTVFDPDTSPPHFEDKKEDAAFRAPVSAASLDYNTVTVWALPGAQAGAPARIAVTPTQDLVLVKSSVVTVAKGHTAVDGNALATSTGTEITLTGQIRSDDWGGEAVRKRIDRPAAFTGAVFRDKLTRAGIRVAHEVRFGAVPRPARLLTTHASDPVGLLVRDMMKFSNNFMAEALLKTIGLETGGAPGTWAKGVAAVTRWIEEVAGLPHGAYRYENGSGLYDSNRFSPEQVVRVLRAGAADFRTGAEYVSALALAGADGTLAKRLRGTPAERMVRAKTGTLRNVSCLTGFAGGGPGATAPLAFAVLVNDIPETGPAARAARSLEDEVAIALALYAAAGE
jgi:D-alanyl-D-alanine carboxypeptidase/D-alanyl-D-alanine-endopeptidase (penicillin-binding protein 4)